MITIKNIQTGETKVVYNTEFVNGYVRSNMEKPLGKRFATSWVDILTETTDGDGQQVFILSSNWEVVMKAERKPRAKKEAKEPEAVTTETTDELKAAEVVAEPVAIDEPTPTKVVEAEDSTDTTNEQALIAAIKNLRGGAVDMEKVREIVREEFARLAAEDAKKAAKVLKAIAKVKGDTKEVHCEDYDDILELMSRGRRVYLYGPAGSGKSHTAEQIARDLGLEFYGQTTIQFAHDVRGYGACGF